MTEWHLDGMLTFTVGQSSVAGNKSENEDAIGIRIPEGTLLNTKGAVAVIADGVSAAEAGKEASETCVRNFLSDYYSTPETWSVKKSSSQVLTALNRWLFGQGSHFTEAHKGYVSTFSCIIFKSHTAHLFHVGDTRIYRYRDGELDQLTRDHSTVISSNQSYLSRAMGLDVALDVDYQCVDLNKNDLFLLSTDGIHDFLSEAEVRAHLALASEQQDDQGFEQCCHSLIEHALNNHSSDNLSCQILRLDSLPVQSLEDVCKKLTELPFPPELSVGVTLDGYQIEKEIHASSRSQIYRVLETSTGKQYCMKTPSVNFDDELGYIERFVLESWIGQRVSNSHVMKVVETHRPKSCLYFLTEYIEGITLARWIKQNPKPAVQEVIFIIAQVAKGMKALHGREILHQDIKPANIMIDRNGEAKIIDFGSCYIQGVAEIDTPLERQGILGTASYSAPEVRLGGVSRVQSDIFSLAVIVYEMLTSKPPFGGKLNECRTEKAFLKTKYVPSYELNPLVPIWIDGAVKKGLRFDPSRRYCDVSEFLHELQHPNAKYKKNQEIVLLDHNPLLFWKVVSGCLFLALCLALYF